MAEIAVPIILSTRGTAIHLKRYGQTGRLRHGATVCAPALSLSLSLAATDSHFPRLESPAQKLRKRVEAALKRLHVGGK
jgi:hypothetical protein